MSFNFLTLGIETSCDDSGVAIIDGDKKILCELLSSQIRDHSRFGGVIPEFAARKHLENLLPLIDSCLKECNISGKNLNLIAVTRGPGLMGSLIVGVQTAKALSQVWKVPLIGVNHLEGHLFAPLVDSDLEPPFLSLIVSGGHTEIIKVESFGNYELLGETRDDAAGEAYDKAAKILGLPYPGGPEIDRLAKNGNPKAFDFPVPLKNSDKIEFSFSGLKTALLWQVKKFSNYDSMPINDLCASFQNSIIESLITKLNLAVKLTGINKISASGGVSANSALRRALTSQENFRVWLPEIKRCTDNAVMIAAAGYNNFMRGNFAESDILPDPSLHEL